MRIAAGILTIIGGLLGGSMWLTIVRELMSDFGVALMVALGFTDLTLIVTVLGLLTVLIGYLPMGLAVVGGIYILKRKRWRLALTGAICSTLFPFFLGIPIILLVKRKGEFD